jgi:hypothetical protein
MKWPTIVHVFLELRPLNVRTIEIMFTHEIAAQLSIAGQELAACHDKHGRLITRNDETVDICDCLNVSCSGFV